LTRSADKIAEITGWGRLLIGSVMLAAATSLPELSVDISAVSQNLPDIAVGDLLGSSLMNLLILAVLDLSHRSRGKMFSRAASAHALSGVQCIALTAIVGIGFLTARRAPDFGLFGVHAAVWAVAVGYLLGVRLIFLDQRISLREAIESGATPPPAHSRKGLVRCVLWFIAAAAIITITGPRLAASAGKIAQLSGLGGSFVGSTFVALSTSLPELVTTIAAVRLGAFDLAVGNIFGSNAFNMLLFFPLDLAFPGTLLAVASPVHMVSVLAVILAMAIAIMGQLYQSEAHRIRLLEPDAWLVIALVLGAMWLIYINLIPLP
jgi:cation:H+ antiporter